MKGNRPILVSIVSHGHGQHVETLLQDLALSGNCESVSVVLRLNQAESTQAFERNWPYPLRIVRNVEVRGFAANHNATFQEFCQPGAAQMFCVLNPDIRLKPDSMRTLLAFSENNPEAALIAPQVLAPDGRLEANARPLPMPGEILRKGVVHLLGGDVQDQAVRGWNWFAGMFMLFQADAFRQVGGFDDRYFLYYEDVDICCRLRLAGFTLRSCPELSVVHDAQRGSHRNFQLFLRHLLSVTRFFASRVYRDCRRLDRRYTA